MQNLGNGSITLGRYASPETRTPCPSCGGTKFVRKFVKKEREFWRCSSCDLLRQDPLPTLKELVQYYDQSYKDGLYEVFAREKSMKEMTARQRLYELKGSLRDGKLLDVGCSNGTFIEAAGRIGYLADGIDLSDVAIRSAKERGLTAFCSTIEDFHPEVPYDNITGFDVIEHVLDPQNFLRHCHRLLRNDGRIVVSLPNEASVFAKVMGPSWYFYIPEEHLHYFRPGNIRKIMKSAGFRVEKIGRTYKPITYDYALTQFREYNPGIYKSLSVLGRAIPRSIREHSFSLYIGEMQVVGTKASD